MAYEVPALPYALDALEPHIDAQTMIDPSRQASSGVRGQGSTRRSRAPSSPTRRSRRSSPNLDAIPEDKRGPVRNNGGGHYNHSLFWESMSPDGGGAPDGDLGAAIDAAFGSFDDFKEKFEAAGVGQFGSGWAWLVARRRRARRHEHAQPGQPAERRQDAAAGQRRLGARLLPEVPEQAPGLPQGVVEHGRLGEGRRALQRRQRLTD